MLSKHNGQKVKMLYANGGKRILVYKSNKTYTRILENEGIHRKIQGLKRARNIFSRPVLARAGAKTDQLCTRAFSIRA